MTDKNFSLVYLDSTELIAGNWPRRSATLVNFFQLKAIFGLNVFLPLAVEKELNAHWMRDTLEKLKKTTHSLEKLNRNLEELPHGGNVDLKIPSPEEIHHAYVEQVTKRKAEWGLISVPFPSSSLEYLFHRSIYQIAPFKQKGEGFQDAIIFESVLEHLMKSGEKVAAFVSNDGIYARQEIADAASKRGLTLSVFSSVDKLSEALKERLKNVIRAEWLEQDTTLRATLQQTTDAELKSFIDQNIEVPETQWPLRLISVSGIEIAEIRKIRTSIPPEVEDGNPFPFTAEILVNIQAVVEKLQLFTEPRTLKVGGGALPPTVGAASHQDLYQREQTILPQLVEVEGSAIRLESGEYKKLEFLTVKLKT